jgi:thiopeptide-type bacteriocin biosynthesis protein
MDPWHQVNITFPDWDHAELTAATRIAPQLDADGLAATWWFIRKHPCWRVRYQSGPGDQARIEQRLGELAAAGHITGWTRVVYEPEVCAFGGPEAMAVAHRLFHADSHGILTCLRDQPEGRHRREISLMLCSVMMRAARQDFFEQGDVWARVADYRKPPPGSNPDRPGPLDHVRRLITADAESQMSDGAPLAHCAQRAAAYATAGRELAGLTAAGLLHRGLRDVLAHHVIFAWNRLGLPYATQSVLAGTAKTAVFGPDPAKAKAG